MTEQEIRQAVSRSQKQGFRVLFQEFYPFVYRIVWDQIRAVGTKEDAEECVSDIFAELFEKFSRIEEGNLQSWIGMLARRRALNAFRRLTGQTQSISIEEELTGELASGEQLEDTFIEAQAHDRLIAHIQALGSPDAQMILLKYFYDYNSVQIAEQLHMNPVTVRVRLSRALKKLRKRLTADAFFME